MGREVFVRKADTCTAAAPMTLKHESQMTGIAASVNTIRLDIGAVP